MATILSTVADSGAFDSDQFDLSAVEVLDDMDAPFNMEVVIDNMSINKEHHKVSKRVRNYEGDFPFLRIDLDPDLGLMQPLTDLPVVKIGKSVRRMVVSRTTSDYDSWKNDTNLPIDWILLV